MTKYYMGVSAYHHDSAAALIDEHGNIICVSQEERRTLIKNDKSWPEESINFCLRHAKSQQLDTSDITYGFYEKPWIKFTRRFCQNPKDTVRYFKEAYNTTKKIKGYKTIMHHDAHALAGCATSPFDNCVYLIVDAVGEWETTTWGTFNKIDGIKKEGSIRYPHSIGLMYSSFTRWLGLKPNEDEYIVMGAAAFGKPRFANKIRKDFLSEVTASPHGIEFKKGVHNGIEQYYGDEVPVKDWYDWCASIQYVCEQMMIDLVRMLEQQYGKGHNLVLGGGVALNCVANSKIMKSTHVKELWILPSPGDSGNALGAAAHAAGINDLVWDSPYLGMDMDNDSNPTQELIRNVVARLDNGEIIGWIQGKEEFGPRSLGHRSLLADPRSSKIKNKINLIKNRQTFRPFAPSVLEEETYMYFDLPNGTTSRYMQFTARVKNPNMLPAICHIDGTTRVQTVPKSTDPFRRLLEHWKETTGCAALLNTSLNIKGQPLMSNRKDAIQMLLDTPMDALVIGNRLYYKITKDGLSDEPGETVQIAECIDYSQGVDDMIKGRF